MPRRSRRESAPSRVRLATNFVELEGRFAPAFFGNNLFPDDNPWNQRITDAPVAANSDAILARIGLTDRLHVDWGNPNDGNLYGIPVNIADSSTPRVPVEIGDNGYADESDVALVPIPDGAVIEGDGPTGPNPPEERGDSHLLVYDKSANVLYELYNAVRPNETVYPYGGDHPTGQWGAYQLSVWDLNVNTFRTPGWTSADAAGLPLLPGLVRPDEALPPSQGGQGVIDHAIRFTVRATRSVYVYPASHEASSRTDNDVPRMGERFRLKASFEIPNNWAPEARAIAQAMKDYGLIVADNGSDMYFQGTPSTLWNMDNVLVLQQIRAESFEVVDLTPVVTGLSATSGSPGGGATVSVYGRNFGGAAGNLHVLFGSTEAQIQQIVSDSEIVVTTPGLPAGTVDVRVRSGSTKLDSDNDPIFFGYGTSVVTPAGQFTFSDAVPPVPPTVPPTIPPTVPPSVPPTTPPTVPPSVPPTVPPTIPPTVPPTIPPTVPPPGGVFVGYREFAAAADQGAGQATLYNPDQSVRFRLEPFGGFAGGVRTAAADFNRDGVADLVVGTGPGIATLVSVRDGKSQEELFAVAPFEASFTGGVYVAAGDLTGDGVPELVITPDEGGGPRVRIFNGSGFAQLADFFGIDDPNFRGGARAAVGDVNGDRTGDLVVAAGFQGGPRVAGFDGRTLGANPRRVFGDFFAFEETLRNGVFVAVGDLDGDGFAEVIAGGGPGGGPRVTAFSGKQLLSNTYDLRANFFGGDPDNRGGVRLAVKDLDNDARADLVVGAGTGAGSRVTVYPGRDLGPAGTPTPGMDFEAYPGFGGGVFVG